MDVCGCYLPQTVYDDYKKKLLAGFPTASASVLGDQQCFYPACVASSLKPYTAQQCSSCLVSCVNNNSTSLIAGGNINNVSSTIEQVNNCGCFPNASPIQQQPPVSNAPPAIQQQQPVSNAPPAIQQQQPVSNAPPAVHPSKTMLIVYLVVGACVGIGLIAGLVLKIYG
ncbi:hypothetical protein EBZ80_24975 [bacterium]|nr:hypothetical protein [bacterium]